MRFSIRVLSNNFFFRKILVLGDGMYPCSGSAYAHAGSDLPPSYVLLGGSFLFPHISGWVSHDENADMLQVPRIHRYAGR